MYLYRVQVSDASLDEVSAASGLSGSAGAGIPENSGTVSAGGPTTTPASTMLTRTRKGNAQETGS